MKTFYSGVVFGSLVYIFLNLPVHRPLPFAILAGAGWAWMTVKENEE